MGAAVILQSNVISRPTWAEAQHHQEDLSLHCLSSLLWPAARLSLSSLSQSNIMTTCWYSPSLPPWTFTSSSLSPCVTFLLLMLMLMLMLMLSVRCEVWGGRWSDGDWESIRYLTVRWECRERDLQTPHRLPVCQYNSLRSTSPVLPQQDRLSFICS